LVFGLHCDVAVVEPETTEAAVRLEEVFVIAQKGQLFWHLEMKYIAPLLTVVPSFRVSIRDILVKKQDLAQFTHCT